MMFFFVIAVSLLRRMSNDFSRPDPVKVESVSKPEEEQPKTEEPEKPKPEISDEMRSRLRRELQSQGADPNFSRGPILGNPILIISFIVAVLVIAGGKDILY